MKKILIIYAHPVKDTFNEQILQAYKKGAERSKAEIEIIKLSDLEFNLNFSAGYRGVQDLEPDLIKAQEKIKWAEHLVFIYPNWWSTYPALLKGFIDRTFLPGFAFKYKTDSLLWEKLLKGKSARIIVTMDTPIWYYKLIYRAPGHHSIKKGILQFCGIKPVRIISLGPIKKSSENKRNSWLQKIENLGSQNK